MNNISNYRKKFYSLLESEMGNVKPLICEESSNMDCKSDQEVLRGLGEGNSPNMSVAKKIAIQDAKSKIVTELDKSNNTKYNLQNGRIKDEKYFQEGTCKVCYEINRKDVSNLGLNEQNRRIRDLNPEEYEEYNKSRTDDYGMLKNKRFKEFIFKNIDEYVSDGLYIDRHPEDEQHIWFVKESDDKIIFRYDYKDRLLKYDDNILGMILDMMSNRPPESYDIIGEYVTEWAKENLVPTFSKDVKKMTGYNFDIQESYNDEEFDGNDPFNENNN